MKATATSVPTRGRCCQPQLLPAQGWITLTQIAIPATVSLRWSNIRRTLIRPSASSMDLFATVAQDDRWEDAGHDRAGVAGVVAPRSLLQGAAETVFVVPLLAPAIQVSSAAS